MKHIQEAVPPLSAPPHNIAPEIENVVMKALAKSPQYRYSSVKEFANALEAVILKVSGQQPSNSDAIKQQPSNSDAIKQQPSNSDAIKQQPSNSDAIKQQPSNSDAIKQQQPANSDSTEQQQKNPIYEATDQIHQGPWDNQGYIPINTGSHTIGVQLPKTEPEENDFIALFKELWESICNPFQVFNT